MRLLLIKYKIIQHYFLWVGFADFSKLIIVTFIRKYCIDLAIFKIFSLVKAEYDKWSDLIISPWFPILILRSHSFFFSYFLALTQLTHLINTFTGLYAYVCVNVKSPAEIYWRIQVQRNYYLVFLLFHWKMEYKTPPSSNISLTFALSPSGSVHIRGPRRLLSTQWVWLILIVPVYSCPPWQDGDVLIVFTAVNRWLAPLWSPASLKHLCEWSNNIHQLNEGWIYGVI